MNRRETLMSVIAHYNVELEKLNNYPEDVYEDGEVIRFDKTFNDGLTYSYAAIKAEGLWYTTGPSSPKGYSWEALLDWIFKGRHGSKITLWWASTYDEIVV